MSLSTFFRQNQDVRERFRFEFTKPKLLVKRPLLVNPLSRRYMLIGTAFDYLMRFYLKHLNPEAVTRMWVAESSITSPRSPILQDVTLDQSGNVVEYSETELTINAKKIIDKAKIDYTDYLKSGKMNDDLIMSAIGLAKLDPMARTQYVDPDLMKIFEEDITELRELASILNPDLFKAKKICLLNPRFGEGSHLVGGADADIFIDDTLIDIKTTKNLEIRRESIDEIIGYFILHTLGSIGEYQPKQEVRKLGIYFARHAYLYTIDVEQLIDEHTFDDFFDLVQEKSIQRIW